MTNIKYSLLVGTVVAVTSLTGCAWSRDKEARETGRTPAQVADDRHISDRVASSLKESPVYKFAGVSVKTYDRVVQLSGFVQTDYQKRAAEEIAQQAPGAVRVINNIVVQEPQPAQAQAPQPQSLPSPKRNAAPNPQLSHNQSGS